MGWRFNRIKMKNMITVLVHYKQWVEACHPMLDDTLENRSKVVKVKDLEELNNMFRYITKIEILERA